MCSTRALKHDFGGWAEPVDGRVLIVAYTLRRSTDAETIRIIRSLL